MGHEAGRKCATHIIYAVVLSLSAVECELIVMFIRAAREGRCAAILIRACETASMFVDPASFFGGKGAFFLMVAL